MNKVIIDEAARWRATQGLCQCPRPSHLCLWTRWLTEVTPLGISPKAFRRHSGVPKCHRLAQTRGARLHRTHPLCVVKNTLLWKKGSLTTGHSTTNDPLLRNRCVQKFGLCVRFDVYIFTRRFTHLSHEHTRIL